MEIKKLIPNKISYLIVALAAGIFLIMVSGMFKNEEKPPTPEIEENSINNTTENESRLAQILETVEGVSDVSVFLTYENTGKKSIAVMTEETMTSEGDKKTSAYKSQVVTAKDGSSEKPFVNKETLPEVRGVIICAKGVGNEKTKLIIADAVSAAMGISTHRVKVLSKD